MMTKYNFDEVIDRGNTLSLKYNFSGRGKPDDTLPLWVADMDFRTPPCVVRALEQQVAHGIFGYSEADSSYFDTLRAWFSSRFSWEPRREWLVQTPGVVVALYLLVRALTEPGDAVLVQQPVYYPFAGAVADTGRKLVINELVRNEDKSDAAYGAYYIDFDDFERKIAAHNVKLFILCNPHNPVGRVWRESELLQMGEICLRYGVTVVADEIHQDFVFAGRSHLVFAGLTDELAEISVTCTAPSKTFNLAGLQASNIFIKNEKLRRAFRKEYQAAGLSQLPVMGLVAAKAAYEGGAGWLDELLVYLEGNMDLIAAWAAELPRKPGGGAAAGAAESGPLVGYRKPEGTYLAWLDFRATGLTGTALDHLLNEKAHVWLSGGYTFGAGGSGFMRVNAACPRGILAKALERIAAVL
jgi:cystathionine beta-lyase